MCKSIIAGLCAICTSLSWGIGASQEWVKNYVTNTSAPTNIMDTVQEWVKEYVTNTSPSTNTIDEILGILNDKTNDEIKIDEDGRLYYTILEKSGTTYTNKVYYLTPGAIEVTEGDYYAARIAESSNDMYKVGDIYAMTRKVGDNDSFYLVKGNQVFEVNENSDHDYITFESSDGRFKYEGDLVEKVRLIQTSASGNEIGYVTFEAIKVFQKTWETALGEDNFETYNHNNVYLQIAWCNKDTPSEQSYQITCNLPRARMMMMRSVGLPEQPTIITIPMRAVPLGNLVDTIDYAAAHGYQVEYNGEWVTPTHENCWATPEVIIPQEDWYNLENWVELPIIVETYYQSDDGLWYPTEKKIRKIDALKTLLAAFPDTHIPPRPWSGFELTAKEDCRITENHIFGKDCRCIVCGHQRKHCFENASNSRCARCTNKYDTYKTDIRGQIIKTGESETACGASPLDADDGLDEDVYREDLHGGWFHEGKGDDETYNCSCECGFFSVRKHEKEHTYNFKEGDIPDDAWSKYDRYGYMDGIHHFALFTCTRCNDAQKEVKERHEIIANPSEPAEYYDSEYHEVQGYCRICGYGNGEGDEEDVSYTLEPHEKDENCYCAECGETMHTWYTYECGKYENVFCIDCGIEHSTESSDGEYYDDPKHEFGYPLPEDHEDYYNLHECACGITYEEHQWENGVCVICDVRKQGGVKCASKKSNKPNSDGIIEAPSNQNHTENRDNSGGFLAHSFNRSTGLPMLEEGCEDCGGNFWLDYADAIASWDKLAEWKLSCISGEVGIERSGGLPEQLIDVLGDVDAAFHEVRQGSMTKGTVFSATINYDPVEYEREVTISNFGFIGTDSITVKGQDYRGKAFYQGVVVEDKKYGRVIEWF